MTHQVTLVPGDGIGPEVVEAARRALEATGVALEWDVQDAGQAALAGAGTILPDGLVASIRERGVALKGPVATQPGSGSRSVNFALRDQLDLHTCVRPCRSRDGVPSTFRGVDVVVVRMITGDLYAGIEYTADDADAQRLRDFVEQTDGRRLTADTGVSLKPISRAAVERVARDAMRYARRHGRRKVTAVHKSTVMQATDGLFLAACREVAETEFPEIHFEDRLVDAVCHDLVRHPGDCDVLLAPMLYGDILSDLCAGLVGGLGMAPGGNFGDEAAVFEAAHGSAPRHAGLDRANPMALMLSGAMLLRHIGEADAADRLEAAIDAVVLDGTCVTYDLRPDRDPAKAAGTTAVSDAVIAALG